MDRAVEMYEGGSYTQFVYSPTGGKLALMSGQSLTKAFVPLSGGATAVYNSSGLAYYRHADWLGSSRFASTTSRGMQYDGAYAPYGENYAEAGTTDRNFTGMNQDILSSGPYPLYDGLYREYHPTWGRWVSPDRAGLAAANPGSPQSWNRYAYVLNNPLLLTDPLGLGVNSPSCLFRRAHAMTATAGSCGAYEGGGVFSWDNGAIPGGLVGLAGGTNPGGGLESAGPCPYGVCSGPGIDTYTGQLAWLEYTIDAAGTTGWLSGYDWTQGVYDVNGQFVSYDAYQSYLQQQYASQIAAQCAKLNGNLSASGASVDCGSVEYVQGGHANFTLVSCGSLGGANGCAGRLDNGVHIEGNIDDGFWAHNDTASPFVGGFFQGLWNAAVHVVVDGIWGSTAIYVFPH